MAVAVRGRRGMRLDRSSDGSREEQGLEGRPAGRMGAGGRFADGADPDAGVQGSETPDGAAKCGGGLSNGHAGRSAGREPFEGGLPRPRHPCGERGLCRAHAAAVDQERLRKEAKTHPITRTLATAPGMGPLRTAQLVAIVATPHRFRTSRQFWSYSGLSIVTQSSSDWVPTKDKRWAKAEVLQTRGLSRQRQPVLKAICKGAATTVITLSWSRQSPVARTAAGVEG
jgi:hypothetical protein